MHLMMDPIRYDAINPPWPIKLWLDKAPMIFLIVSALMFIVGLNLFAYLTSQVRVALVLRVVLLRIIEKARYVSLSTNVFTGAHSLCLFVVVIWFIYQLKRRSVLVQRVGSALSSFVRTISPLYEGERSRHYQRNVFL